MRPPVPAARGPDQPSILSRGRPSGQAQRCANCTTNRQAGRWNTPRRKAAMPSTIANQDAAEHADIPQSDSLEAIISLARMLHWVSQKSSDARLGGDKRDLGWSLAVF